MSFADRITARSPLMVFGPEVDGAGAWEAGVAFAEKVGAPVYSSPLADRVSFPENHRLYQGPLPMTIAGAAEVMRGHDLVVVVGAEVFRYYPYVAGEYLPAGTELLQITADPEVGGGRAGRRQPARRSASGVRAARGPGRRSRRPPAARRRPTRSVDRAESAPLTPDAVWSTLAAVKPAESALVMESTSTLAEQRRWLPTTGPASIFATASGGIGWGVPAAVGIALADRARGVNRPVVATIGDGSFQYSVQAIWTAAQHRLPVVFVVMRNGEYSILKSFAELEKTPACPGWICPALTSLPSRPVSGAARSTWTAPTSSRSEFTAALDADGPTVIVVPTKPQPAQLG